jgi:glyoxylase-like metal-dependent hydrolase (beta-lactamase superfamily II)
VTTVSQRIIPIDLGFATVFILADKKTILVDTGLPDSAGKIIDKMHKHGFSEKDLALIFLTHGHIDHFGAAHELRDVSGAPVAAHAADAPYISSGTNPPVNTTDKIGKFVRSFIDERAAKTVKGCPVDIFLRDGDDLSPYGISASVVHTPGHTEGSVSLLLPDNCAIVADMMMSRLVEPLIPRYPFFADDANLVRHGLQNLLDRGIQKFYSSHGGPFGRAAVERLLREPLPGAQETEASRRRKNHVHNHSIVNK